MIKRGLSPIAKLIQPSSSGIFPRERLFRTLDRKRSHPALWITGPPGSGKTSLVSSYLADRKIPCLWYQVDRGDGDVPTFFYYMGLAARRAVPRRRQPLPLLTPEFLHDIPAFARRYFERLCCQLIDGNPARRISDTPPQFIIVFDNYQEAQEGSSFHEIIRQGLLQIPAGMTVFVISRQGPPDVLARMRANRLMAAIGWNELRFTLDESRRMVRLRGFKRLSNEGFRQLHEKTDGWAAGLVLLTERMREEGLESLLKKPIPEEVFSYFAGEVFNETDEKTRDFLVKTAIFPRMTHEMAEDLTEFPHAKRILIDLSRKNYFTQRHESQTLSYQYHPLFRDFLQAQARNRFGAGELSAIVGRAALILAENGQIEDAADLMAKTNRWPDLVRLILEHGNVLISQGRNWTLENWIHSLPKPLIEENPWLLYWLGICRLPFSPAESEKVFERAFELFRARGEAAGIYLSLSGLFDSTTYGMGNFKAYDRWIDLLKQVEKESKPPSEEIEARLTASMAFAIIARQPKHPGVGQWIDRALFLVERSPDLYVKTRTLQSLASQWIFTGNLSKAARVIDSFQEVAQSPDLSPLLVILLKMLEAIHGWMSGSFEECRMAASQGLALASSAGVHLWDNFLLGHAAAGALSAGDAAEAGGFLKRMSSSLGRMPAWGKEYYHGLAAWASIVEGDLAGALSHVELCLTFSAEAGMLLTEAFDHLGKALALIELKKGKEARDEIGRVETMAQSFNAPLVEFAGLLARARLELDEGNEPAGLESLRMAMTLGREQGYINTFFWHAPMMASLCKKALDEAIEVEYVQGLIRRRSLFPDPPPDDCEQWPWPLKIFTLGRFEMVRDGERLGFPVRAPRKVLSLLKVLVAFGRKGMSDDQLTDNLWPEAEGDMAHQALATTLHRLRQLLGDERVIRLREGHAKFDGRFCWVDAHVFEHMLERSEASRSVSLLQRAVALYAGPFLGDGNLEPWAISYQERLRNKFLRAVGKLGQYLERSGDQEKAIECYRKGLEVDVLAEAFYQRLMVCYQASGRKAEALALYDRCRQTLLKTLGVEPSPETRAIYDTVRRR